MTAAADQLKENVDDQGITVIAEAWTLVIK